MDRVPWQPTAYYSRTDSGHNKVDRVLPARKPTAVTELASLSGPPITEALARVRAGVVPVEIYYRCLGASVL